MPAAGYLPAYGPTRSPAKFSLHRAALLSTSFEQAGAFRPVQAACGKTTGDRFRGRGIIGELGRLAEAIYHEIERQLPNREIDGASGCRDLHAVFIDGQLDLVKIAASLTRRFCVLEGNLETVMAQDPSRAGSISARSD